MEKYLVKENLDIAQANILNIEENFVRPLSILANAIKDLGLEVTKENLFDALTNNGEALMQLFNESRNNYNEMDSRLATLADEVDNKKIQAFNEALFPFKGSATIYNGMSVTAPELLCCIGIDENGSVYLLDSTKQEIIENAKEFCNTKAGKDLFYNPQIQIFAESETKRPFFECSFKTKRTKKGLAHNTNNKARNKSQNHSISGFVKHNSTGNIIAFK